MKGRTILKKERLHLQKDIIKIFDKGKQFQNKYLKIFILPNNLKFNRFMPVINKKFGKSTIRNKAKRRLRVLYRTNKPVLKKGFDIIFFIKNEFNNISFKEIKENFIQLLQKNDLINEK